MIWKLVHWIHESLFWILLAGLILWLLGILEKVPQRSRAKDLADGAIRFGKGMFDLWTGGVIGVWAVLIAAEYLRRGFGDRWHFWTGVLFGLAAFVMTCDIPGDLVVSHEGIEQVYWFWKNKRIGWKEIVEINTGKKNRFVEITGADGTRIRYSGPLADLPRLFLELKLHCGENLPPEFPSEPMVE